MAKAICEKLMLVLVALILCSVGGAATTVEGKNYTDLEIWNELRRLNKPAIKTIKSEDGDIIDCVDIYKQPAFDHPLLQNHTIQRRPSFYDRKMMQSSKPLAQLWHNSGSCPRGTIPIRRTQKEDLLRVISSKGQKVSSSSEIEQAKMVVEVENHGAEASINVWAVFVEPSEYSGAVIYVRKKGSPDFVRAGWMIYKDIMEDANTRVYTSWGAAGAGCYNLICPGFVQVSHKVALGSTLNPVSIYDYKQYWMNVRISKDPGNGNWWLVLQGESVGYWPGALFKDMAESADQIEWAGEILNTKPRGQHTSTQMGSGHFSKEGYQKAAFFDNCVYLVGHDDARKPSNAYLSATKPSCYDVSETSKGRDRGLWFHYGGPGGGYCDK